MTTSSQSRTWRSGPIPFLLLDRHASALDGRLDAPVQICGLGDAPTRSRAWFKAKLQRRSSETSPAEVLQVPDDYRIGIVPAF